jgi:epimerase transport system membrane fusion protein
MREAIREFLGVLKTALSAPPPDYTKTFDESVLESDQRARNFGYAMICVLLFGFGGWAALAPLESAAIGSGTVQVEGDTQPVQHLEGGMVTEILISNGDYVQKDQPLLRIDSTQASADQSIVKGRLWAKQAAIDRLLSERDGKESVVISPMLASADDERARIAAGNEHALFDARRSARLGEVSVLEQKIRQLQKQIEGSKAVLEAKNSVAESLTVEITELNELLIDGYVDKQRIRELDRSLVQTLGDVANLDARIAEAEVAIEEARLNIIQLNKRFITAVIGELSTSQDELFDLEQRYTVFADQVARSTVRSPTSGYVMNIQLNSIGAVIGRGEQIMEVVPDVDKVIIDVQMSPMDIDRIRVGQRAEVRFSVFKDSYSLTGELAKISADTVVDDMTGAPHYKATVQLLEEDLYLLGENKLVPGMPASVFVKTGNRTLLGYLTSPLQRMFENSLTED